MTMVITDDTYDKNKPCVLFENLFTQGTVTATEPAADYYTESAISGTTWDRYKPASIGVASYAVDMGAAVEVDCAFIDAHNFADNGTTVSVQRSTDGITWATIDAPFTVDDNSAIMVLFRGVEYRYWRISMDSTTAASVGVLMIGKRLVFPNGIDSGYTSIPHAKKYTLIGGNSDAGQFTGQMLVRKGAMVSPTFPLLDREWVDTDMKEFEAHYNEGKPFAWAASPSFNGDDMGFCWRPSSASELSPSYYEGGMYEEFTMNMAVYIND